MSEPTSNLFGELKRRRVFRVAGVYVVAGFAVIEGADLLFPRLGLPDWTVTLVMGLVLLGFPLAVALAWAFDFTPEGIQRTPGEVDASPVLVPAARIAVVGAVLIIAVAAAGFFLTRGTGRAPELDPEAVAVLPFRVGGADPSLAYLREGVVDLLAAKLTGEAGPRAVNPRTMLTAWRAAAPSEETGLPPDQAIELARELGAGQLLVGDVVGTATALTIRAELIDTETGGATQAEQSGSVEELTSIVDRLAATLMALEAGERRPRLDQLTTTSLPALRAYLQGRSAFRAARYSEAADRFADAVEEDSTFALAALGMSEALRWWAERPGGEEALRLAWKYRDRLSERDRAYLRAFAGPNYPRGSTRAVELAAYEQALDQSPDDPMLWYHVGDVLYHSGAQLGVENALERAAAHLEQALALDPAFAPAAEHLFALALRLDDPERTREVGRRYLTMDADAAGTIRWWLGRIPGATVDSVPTLEQLTTRDLQRIVGWAVDGGFGVAEADPAMDLIEERVADAGTPFQVQRATAYRTRWEWRRGRHGAARRLLDAPAARLAQALFAPVDTGVAEAAAGRVRAAVDTLAVSSAPGMFSRYLLAEWSLRNGQTSTARELVGSLAAVEPADDPSASLTREFLLALLEAELGVLADAPDARDRVAELDRLTRQVPPVGLPIDGEAGFGVELANLALIRLHEALGDPEAALAAARRRAFTVGTTLFLAVQVREEGRLAERLGRREEAITAYRTYLEFRAEDADAPVLEEVARVQTALARLTAEGR